MVLKRIAGNLLLCSAGNSIFNLSCLIRVIENLHLHPKKFECDPFPKIMGKLDKEIFAKRDQKQYTVGTALWKQPSVNCSILKMPSNLSNNDVQME
jgi:hypothetical protein